MADAFIVQMERGPLNAEGRQTAAWVARVANPEAARRLAGKRLGRNGWRIKEVVKAPAGTIARLGLAAGQMIQYR